jgi:hypothetical protein
MCTALLLAVPRELGCELASGIDLHGSNAERHLLLEVVEGQRGGSSGSSGRARDQFQGALASNDIARAVVCFQLAAGSGRTRVRFHAS